MTFREAIALAITFQSLSTFAEKFREHSDLPFGVWITGGAVTGLLSLAFCGFFWWLVVGKDRW